MGLMAVQHRQRRAAHQVHGVVAVVVGSCVALGALARPRRAFCPCALSMRAMPGSLPRYTPSLAGMGTMRVGGTEAKRGSLATASSAARPAVLKAWLGMDRTACGLPSRAARRARWRAGAPRRPGLAVRLDPVQRAAGRSRHRALGGQHRRQLRQRAGREHPPAQALEDARGTLPAPASSSFGGHQACRHGSATRCPIGLRAVERLHALAGIL
ncbi:MAG: hypothetical protein RL227_795 [Pseudomonadota bacterium]